MRLSVSLPSRGAPDATARHAQDLERVGVDLLWVPELYGFDAVSLLGYLAARTRHIELGAGILPLFARTPALTAMTAAGLDAVSGGRFVLGLGASGPQVVEGWHGVPYHRPLARTREIVAICRTVWQHRPLEHDGELYPVPLPPGRGTGLGRPLKLVDHPVRDRIPIHLAALGPANVRLAAEIADGWLPVLFHPERAAPVWGEALAAGAAARDPGLAPLDVVAGGALALCDAATAREVRDRLRPWIALYVGGMGARQRNFYNDLFRRYGYAAEAEAIQDLYLAGHRQEAAARVPEEFLVATTLVGEEGHVRDRVEAFRAAGASCLDVRPVGDDPIGDLARLRDWLG